MKGNLQVFYMPCGCVSLNLVVGDSGTSYRESTSLIGTVQRICFVFCLSLEMACTEKTC